KKTWEFGGYIEMTAEHLRLNRDALLYRYNFPDKDEKSFERYQEVVEFSGQYRNELFSLHGLLNARLRHDIFETRDDIRFYQLFAKTQPVHQTELEIGKRTLRWGTGYAFNPVAFLERPKDPMDPGLSREGFIIAGASYVRSFTGALQAMSASGVILPVTNDINDDFGPENSVNAAARLYLLYCDTDIDFMIRAGETRPTALGMDFSRNLADNFEVHGEIAWFNNRKTDMPGSDGTKTALKADPVDLLAGFRYLTARETTWIFEYYRNGAGYTGSEMRRLFDMAESEENISGFAPGRTRIRPSGSVSPQPMRDYLYIRIIQNEPFNRLFTKTGASAMINLHDGSASIVPEVIYTGFSNLELRARAAVLAGGENTDFGERLNRWRIEIRGRYFF
ncbi:MAG: hypothetical protein ACQES8_06855, partial [Thermodesulfobacteriota bacterium]